MIYYKNILAALNLQIKSIFSGHPIAIAGLIGFVIFVLTALLAPWIAPQNPYDLMVLDIMDGLLPP
jgi:peptide/nickel transport system permease protein